MAIGDFTVGQAIERPFSISPKDMELFAQISGDRNPMHWDAAMATSHGFKGPVVYGGLLVARVSELLGMWLPGPGCIWVSLSLAFVRALYVGEEANLKATVTSVSEAVKLVGIKHVILRGDEIIARGNSEAIIHD